MIKQTKNLRTTHRNFFSSAKNKVSVSVGETSPPLLKTPTYDALLQEQIEQYPFKNFFAATGENLRWTYQEAKRQHDALACGVVEACGPSVMSALPLRSESVMAQASTVRANRVFVPVEPGTDAEQLESQLKAVNPGTLIFPAKVGKTVQLDTIYKIFPYFENTVSGHRISDKRFDNLRYVVHISRTELRGMTHFPDVLVYGNDSYIKRIDSNASINTPNTVIFSKDNSRRIGLSQANILNTGNLVGALAGVTEEDVVLSTIPQHKASGLALGLALVLARKCTLVYGAEVFSADAIRSALTDEFATALVCLPNELEALLAQGEGLGNVSKIIVAQCPTNRVTDTLLQRVNSLNKKLVVTFGTNEATGVITASSNPTKSNVIGRPLPHTQVSIVDGSNAAIPYNSTGSLTVKGFNVGTIVGASSSSGPAIRNGELFTGLKASMDESGVVSLSNE